MTVSKLCLVCKTIIYRDADKKIASITSNWRRKKYCCEACRKLDANRRAKDYRKEVNKHGAPLRQKKPMIVNSATIDDFLTKYAPKQT